MVHLSTSGVDRSRITGFTVWINAIEVEQFKNEMLRDLRKRMSTDENSRSQSGMPWDKPSILLGDSGLLNYVPDDYRNGSTKKKTVDNPGAHQCETTNWDVGTR